MPSSLPHWPLISTGSPGYSNCVNGVVLNFRPQSDRVARQAEDADRSILDVGSQPVDRGVPAAGELGEIVAPLPQPLWLQRPDALPPTAGAGPPPPPPPALPVVCRP